MRHHEMSQARFNLECARCGLLLLPCAASVSLVVCTSVAVVALVVLCCCCCTAAVVVRHAHAARCGQLLVGWTEAEATTGLTEMGCCR